LPHLLLRQALDRRDTVRSLGPATFEGKPQDVFTFVTADEQQVAVYVDATSALVTKYETRIDDPLAGDAASEVIFEDYARIGATQVPRSLRLQEAVSQNTLAVEFKDYIVAVEAPGSSSGAEGATVITTGGTRKIVEQFVAAPHADRLSAQPRPPEFLMLEKGRRVLTDGSRTVELIDIGPHPHASEMVIAYLPNERVLFQGDMFIIPRNEASSGPPAPTRVSFAKKLEELRLDVDRIGSVHGRSSTIEELRTRLKD
jgi:hypothetical protein